jgi:hypothetical protein
MPDKLSFEDHPNETAKKTFPAGQMEAKTEAPAEEKASEKVTLPKTEAEIRAVHLKKIESESDDDRSARRDGELKALFVTHLENANKAHEMFPTRRIPFTDMTRVEQLNWNSKRKNIDMANRAYHLAVKRTCANHRTEDIHLAKVRDAAAKSAQ